MAWTVRIVTIGLAAGLLAACSDKAGGATAAAGPNPQVCYRFVSGVAGKAALVSAPDENLETCAMHLEGWRMMHGLTVVNGTYRGQYVFATAKDISSAMGPQSTRYRVYTPGQHAQLDQQLQSLIDRAKTASANTTGGNKTGD